MERASDSREPEAQDVAAVRARIEQWRSTRARLGPMPEELWAAAVGLVGEHGLYPVARALPVEYGALKKRFVRAGAQAGGAAAAAGFVEVQAPRRHAAPEPPPAGAVVELAAGDGSKLTVRLPAGEAVDLAGLARTFWRRGA